MPRRVDIRLGEKPYTVSQLRTRQSSGWRKEVVSKLGGIVQPLLTVLDWKDVDTRDAEMVQALVGAISPVLLDTMDVVTECLLAYAPELREAVEQAYDDEMLHAFFEVLKLSVPFEEIGRLLSGSGSKTTAISPNLPSASGADGTTN